MILVHSLSQIKNPIENHKIAKYFVKLNRALINTHQPKEDE